MDISLEIYPIIDLQTCETVHTYPKSVTTAHDLFLHHIRWSIDTPYNSWHVFQATTLVLLTSFPPLQYLFPHPLTLASLDSNRANNVITSCYNLIIAQWVPLTLSDIVPMPFITRLRSMWKCVCKSPILLLTGTYQVHQQTFLGESSLASSAPSPHRSFCVVGTIGNVHNTLQQHIQTVIILDHFPPQKRRTHRLTITLTLSIDT